MSSTASKALEPSLHSQLEGNTAIPDAKRATLEKLLPISPPIEGPVIAVDFDDVLSRTNEKVAEWHNEQYGSSMDISDFYYYYYWKNPFWGTLAETFKKMKAFYETDIIFHTEPVTGAREGIQTLRNMGFKLVIVTARPDTIQERSWQWVQDHFPGMFETIICTGQFKNADETARDVATNPNKAQICTHIGAQLLIDDSAENALQCATANPSTKVLLYGDYEWNHRISGPEDTSDDMAFERRLKAYGGQEFWKDEKFDIPNGAPLWRAKDWSAVIRWISKAIKEGTIQGPTLENP